MNSSVSEGGKIQESGAPWATFDATLTHARSRRVLRMRERLSEGVCNLQPAVFWQQNGVSFTVPLGPRSGSLLRVPNRQSVWRTRAPRSSGERSWRSRSLFAISNGLSWSRPRGQTDSPTSTTRTHLAPTLLVVRANVCAFGILWLLKFIILNRLYARIADTELGAELKVGPRAEVRGRGVGWSRGCVGTENHVRGKNR